MAVKIRLARRGAKKRPCYKIVVAEAKSPRDGRFIEIIGAYNPLLSESSDQRIIVDAEKAKKWLGNGAIPTETVAKLFKRSNITA